MIPNHKDRELESEGVTASGAFGISLKDSAHIMTILRDTLYSDKILAVLREYGANAWDAHRMVGKGDVPISITLPTEMDPVLLIRDFGPGLSHGDVFQVFTQYGASTKRNDDNAVGMLGIGSKSGFAYSDSFTVTSWHGGAKRVYVAVLDKTEEGIMNLLHEEPCGEETGLMIQLAIRQDDISEFHDKARRLFQHFKPQPIINIELLDITKGRTVLKNGFIGAISDFAYTDHGWTAVMGCVPYRINLAQLRGYADYISNIAGVLYFDIGEVQINASREELKYSDGTKKAIVEKLEALVDEFVAHTMQEIEASAITPWEKKLRVQIFRKLHLPVPATLKEVALGMLSLEERPQQLVFGTRPLYKRKGVSNKVNESVGNIFIKEQSRIVIRDDSRPLFGFNLSEYDYLVRRADKKGWGNAQAILDEFLEKVGLTGIPVVRLSDLPFRNPNDRRYAVNLKHKLTVFKMIEKPTGNKPYSGNWEAVTDRTPSKDDVFVLLDSFQPPYGIGRFIDMLRKDKTLLDALRRPMPEIYGYKTTENFPVREQDVVGTEYEKWSRRFAEDLIGDEEIRLVEQMHWAEHPGFNLSSAQAGRVIKSLGPTHQISMFLRRYLRERKRYRWVRRPIREAIVILHDRLRDGFGEPEVDKQKKLIKEKYPLLFLHRTGLQELWSGEREAWVGYVKMMDKIQGAQHGRQDPVHADRGVDHGGVAGEKPHGAEGDTELREPEDSAPQRELGRGTEAPEHQPECRSLGEGEVHG